MDDHELELAAQTAVDVVSDYYGYVLPPEALDELKKRILGRLHERFKKGKP